MSKLSVESMVEGEECTKSFQESAQRAQDCLIKASTSNHVRDPYIIY